MEQHSPKCTAAQTYDVAQNLVFQHDGHRVFHHAGGMVSTELSNDNPTVAILLCTYNGAKFLHEQLQSLKCQSLTSWRLVWRDDGSTDETRDILARFAAEQSPGQVIEAPGSGQHIGVFDGFCSLLDTVRPAEFAALCDQDDVWLPHRLARAAALLCRVPPGRPGLYCARQMLTDSALTPLGQSFTLRKPMEFPAALMENIVTGCSAMLNPAAVQIIQVAQRPQRSLHDWWSYLMILSVGGDVIFDEAPALLYRQHGSNSVGAAPSMAVRLWRALVTGPKALGPQLFDHLDALLKNANLLTSQNLAITARIRHAYAGNLRARLELLRVNGLYRQGRLANFINTGFLLLGSRGTK